MTDSQESTSSTHPSESVGGDFRFSASYASRYNNCHGSANLPAAIPGFEHPPKNDSGMKGEGTVLHKVFEDILLSGQDLEQCAQLLYAWSELFWMDRVKLVDDEKQYITWWFLKNKTMPPVELSVLKLLYTLKMQVKKTGEEKMRPIPPRRLQFLADALRYVNELMGTMTDPVLRTEVSEQATWLVTAPRTTVDIVIEDKYQTHVLDLKMGDIEVSPIGNEQLMYYGKTFRSTEKLTVHILQRNNIEHWEVPEHELKRWSESMQESERAIMAGDLTLKPGSHCTFCPANPHSRGDRGTKACPAMMYVLYGERDATAEDLSVVEDDNVE